MRLPGRLRGTTLGDLLGALHRERTSGVLELIEVVGVSAGRSHRIVLEAGLVAAVRTSLRVARVGEILREQGLVGDEALKRLARRLVETPGRRAGEILEQDVALSPALVNAALRRQLRLRLDALFGLRDAELRFHVARPSEKDGAPPLSPREFLHGRPRARDAVDPGARPRSGARSNGSGQERARARAFAVLGLRPGADRGAVQRAFRQLAAKLHPDRHWSASSNEKAELLKQFSELSAAYHLLVA